MIKSLLKTGLVFLIGNLKTFKNEKIFFCSLPILVFLFFNLGYAQVYDIGHTVDNYLSPLVTGNNFSGSILISQNKQGIINKGYGLANITYDIPNSPQTKFHIASLSKIFTAASILKLEQEGLLQLSDPIIKYIPSLQQFEHVTVHHLLSHYSVSIR